jgi:hypothetical protein
MTNPVLNNELNVHHFDWIFPKPIGKCQLQGEKTVLFIALRRAEIYRMSRCSSIRSKGIKQTTKGYFCARPKNEKKCSVPTKMAVVCHINIPN